MSAKPTIRAEVADFNDTRRALATVNTYLSGLFYSTANTANPPTDAQLTTEFGSPATVGRNFAAILDDGGGNANVYLVASNGTSWWYATLTKAV